MLYSTQQAQTLQLSALLMDTNLKQRQKSKQKGKRDTEIDKRFPSETDQGFPTEVCIPCHKHMR